MVQFFDSIPENLEEWALQQQTFLTASAPLTGKHVNISPKGLPSATFKIFDPNHAAYVDATGSGSETISQVYENRRITIMFCSFAKSPRIMRFFCMGSVVEWDSPRFEPFLRKMGKGRIEGAKSCDSVGCLQSRVQASCGFGVSLLSTAPNADDPEAQREIKPVLLDRDTMGHWSRTKIEKNELLEWQADYNSSSIDRCPGMRTAVRDHGDILWLTLAKARMRRILMEKDALFVGVVFGVALLLLIQSLQRHLVFL